MTNRVPDAGVPRSRDRGTQRRCSYGARAVVRVGIVRPHVASPQTYRQQSPNPERPPVVPSGPAVILNRGSHPAAKEAISSKRHKRHGLNPARTGNSTELGLGTSPGSPDRVLTPPAARSTTPSESRSRQNGS